MSTYKVNNAGDAAVSKSDYWMPIDNSTPLGVKLQLHTKHGIATYGILTVENKPQYIGWAPCLKRPQWMLDAMSPYGAAKHDQET